MLSETIQNYLETILILSERTDGVHAADICAYLGYSRPTVSVVLGKLKREGLLDVDGENHVRLTDHGHAIASRMLRRHRVLTDFLQRIGVPGKIAAADACKMEHDISEETFSAICKAMEDHFS